MAELARVIDQEWGCKLGERMPMPRVSTTRKALDVASDWNFVAAEIGGAEAQHLVGPSLIESVDAEVKSIVAVDGSFSVALWETISTDGDHWRKEVWFGVGFALYGSWPLRDGPELYGFALDTLSDEALRDIEWSLKERVGSVRQGVMLYGSKELSYMRDFCDPKCTARLLTALQGDFGWTVALRLFENGIPIGYGAISWTTGQ